MFVYLITNIINNKKYVGQTVQTIEKRFTRHCWDSTWKNNMPISLAINKYGKDKFLIECLKECLSQQELDQEELRFALELNTFSPNGYNLRAGSGSGSMSGETKEKIRKSNLGKKASQETLRKLSLSHTGYKVSDETKRKLSDINKGKRGSDLCYQRSSEANAKVYNLITPDGESISITNMRQFCIANNLSTSKMCQVSTGKQKQHKGWRLTEKEI
jgi:group I intron endonuclease